MLKYRFPSAPCIAPPTARAAGAGRFRGKMGKGKVSTAARSSIRGLPGEPIFREADFGGAKSRFCAISPPFDDRSSNADREHPIASRVSHRGARLRACEAPPARRRGKLLQCSSPSNEPIFSVQSNRATSKIALEKLGFRVDAGPDGQDDLVAKYGEKYAVIEVKGRDQASAGEKDAAQLEKWNSRFYEEQGKEPKSILVVNAYRQLPLDKRAGEVFPNQMLKYCERKGQCLISGLQLLCLVHSANSEAERQAAAESLFGTTGIPNLEGRIGAK